MKDIERCATMKLPHILPLRSAINHKPAIVVYSLRSTLFPFLSLPYLLSRMTWPFCPDCRATLKVDASGDINCDVCPYKSNLSRFQPPSTTTYSSLAPSPIWAKSDVEQAALKTYQDPVRATIEEPCIRCAHPEVGYYTVQMRSVDEGQTVFYECPNCKHTWSINN
jgi:DNA-directed RNA polymerase I subunit RPA12